MTIIELCDQLEEAIAELTPEVQAEGWRWMQTALQDDAAHVEEYRIALEATREHFKTEGPQPLSGVWCAEADAYVCNCGTSPHSKARAHYIMLCQPAVLKVLIETVRAASAMAEELNKLAKEAKKDCMVETPMVFTVPKAGRYEIGVDYANGSDECTAAIILVGQDDEPDELVTTLHRDKETGKWKEEGK
jgi:hypothetical protein